MVIWPLSDWTCSKCGGTGDFLLMDDTGPLCRFCAKLDQLVYLPAGDAALSRHTKQASGLSAIVVRFSRSRKRYERQGILIEESALKQAEGVADDQVRTPRRPDSGDSLLSSA